MSDLLTRIAAHGEEALGERVAVEVPEWGCTLWFPKTITVAKQQRIRKGVDANDKAAMAAAFIMHTAENEDGSPAFERTAKTRATIEGKADLRLLWRIMGDIGADMADEDVETAKNG